ncbi:uncharacterized protein O3C94_004172 [Discoglossus pictus]
MESTPHTSPPPAEPLPQEEAASDILQEETESLHSVQTDESLTKKKRTRKGKKKTHKLASEENVFTELPFANVDIQALFEITRTSDKKVKKKMKRKLLENDNGGTRKMQKRANYFVSLPIENPKILSDIQHFQETVLQKDKRLSRAMILKGSFHITLFVMHLATEEEVSLAVSALLESKGPVEEILQGNALIFSFHGVADFKHEVVFGKMVEDNSIATLQEIAETIEKIFKEKGIVAMGYKGFTPHLTFMKLSRAPKLRKQGLKKIDPGLYEQFQDHCFGDETLRCLDLCSMIKKRQPNGYYHTEATIYFGSANNSYSEVRSSDVEPPSEVPHSTPSLPPSENGKSDTLQSEATVKMLTSNTVCNGRDVFVIPGKCKLNENAVNTEGKEVIKETKLSSENIQASALQRRYGQDKAGKDITLTTSKLNPDNSGSSSNAALQTTIAHLPTSSNINVGLVNTSCKLSLSDTSQTLRAKVQALPSGAPKDNISYTETIQQNSEKINLQNQASLSNEALIADMVSLQRQRMQAEQEQWERNEKNMGLLFERLATIQEQQRYTNKNLKGIRNELSFIGKQLSQIVQLFQPAVGSSTACQSDQTELASGHAEREEDLMPIKEDLPQKEGFSQDLIKKYTEK